MKLKLIIACLVLTSVGCSKKKVFDGPNQYADGFEQYVSSDQLIDGNNELWSFFQLTREGNGIRIDSTIVHTGQKSVRFEDVGSSEGDLSKCSINKQFMAFWEGEKVAADFWYYLGDTLDAQWLFIFDLEEKVPIGAGPGMRLAIVDNQILLEHKYSQPNVKQDSNGVEFPRNQWVHIRFEALLSRKDEGTVRVWQDDVLIISRDNWQTLPKDVLYVNQGSKGMYSQIEFGITANPSETPHVMYLDDVFVSVIP